MLLLSSQDQKVNLGRCAIEKSSNYCMVCSAPINKNERIEGYSKQMFSNLFKCLFIIIIIIKYIKTTFH